MKEGAIRGVVLSGMGIVYALAFISYFVQFPGLGGVDGVEPVYVHWGQMSSRVGATSWKDGMQKYPTLLWAAKPLGFSVDEFMEGVSLVGIVAGALIASGYHFAPLFALCFALYSTIVSSSQSMLSFQWDILILETGFICMFYTHESPGVKWLLRVLAFKFFLMTGSVKVQSGCNTWRELTALNYHYASQCIPTPLAYYASLVPEWYNKVSLSFVLFTQFVGPFLLVAPFVVVRRIGVALQVVSMIGIQLTGNYNWFNFHALLLALPSWASDPEEDGVTKILSAASAKRYAFAVFVAAAFLWNFTEDGLLALLLCTVAVVPSISEGNKQLQVIISVLALAAIYFVMYTKHTDKWEVVEYPINRTTPAALKGLFNLVLPPVFTYFTAVVIASSVVQILEHLSEKRTKMFHFLRTTTDVMVMALVLCILPCTLYPMKEIHEQIPKYMQVKGTPAGRLTQAAIQDFFPQVRAIHASSPYGLFRVMTGVGKKGEVAVPVLVMEYTTKQKPKGSDWVPIQFRYAPGDVEQSPPWVAPHQPRVDWRLWFAALGSLRSDPWVMHLASKILRKSEPALHLLGLVLPPSVKPAQVRGTLYHYNFTTSLEGKAWWNRQRVREWLPPVSLKSKELAQMSKSLGWEQSPQESVPKGRSSFIKEVARSIRETRLHMKEVRREDQTLQMMFMLTTLVFIPKVTKLIFALFLNTPAKKQSVQPVEELN